jgi:hypothetical protein
MPRRSALVAALALTVALGGGAGVVAQENNRIDHGVNAGDYSSSSAGTDGNVVTTNPDRRIPGVTERSPGAAATETPASGSSFPAAPVIPPNPALSGNPSDPNAIAPTITEETTSGGSVLGPAPDSSTTVTDDASGGSATGEREGRRSTGEASASASDGTSVGGSINETIPATTGAGSSGTTPASSTSSRTVPSGGSQGACGYPTWLDAQTALETEWTEELADALDPDRDGIACEEAMI